MNELCPHCRLWHDGKTDIEHLRHAMVDALKALQPGDEFVPHADVAVAILRSALVGHALHQNDPLRDRPDWKSMTVAELFSVLTSAEYARRELERRDHEFECLTTTNKTQSTTIGES